MKVIFLFALVLCLVGAAWSAACNSRSCPYNYSPICGRDRRTGRTLTFSNECAMMADNDCGKGYVKLHEGSCRNN